MKNALTRLSAEKNISGRLTIDYMTTATTSLMVLMAGFYLYKLAGRLMGPDGFAIYALVRRAIALIVPFAIMGIGVALPREVGFAKTKEEWSALLASGLVLVAPVALALWIVSALLPSETASLMLGSPQQADVSAPLGALCFGLCVHAVVYGYLRGRLRIQHGNLLVLVTHVICPLTAFVLAAGSIRRAISFWAFGVTVSNIGALLLCIDMPASVRGTLRNAHWQLLRIGLPRVLGDFALALSISLPSLYVARTGSLDEAGIVAFGTSLMTLVGAVIAPLSTVLLPHTARIASSGDLDKFIPKFWRLFALLVFVGVVATSAILIALPSILAWIGAPASGNVTSIAGVLVLSAFPYGLFVSVRSINDALYKPPINAYAAYGCLSAQIATLFALPNIWAAGGQAFVAAISLAFGTTTLALVATGMAFRATRYTKAS